MVDIQYNTTIMGGREVSRPYRVWFFAERLFFMFLFQSPPSIYPLNQVFLLTGDSLLLVGGEIKKRKSGGDFLFFVVETKGFEPLTSAM